MKFIRLGWILQDSLSYDEIGLNHKFQILFDICYLVLGIFCI
jgi:hypothetical protein